MHAQGWLIHQDAATLAVGGQKGRPIVAVVRVDGEVGRVAVTHRQHRVAHRGEDLGGHRAAPLPPHKKKSQVKGVAGLRAAYTPQRDSGQLYLCNLTSTYAASSVCSSFSTCQTNARQGNGALKQEGGGAVRVCAGGTEGRGARRHLPAQGRWVLRLQRSMGRPGPRPSETMIPWPLATRRWCTGTECPPDNGLKTAPQPYMLTGTDRGPWPSLRHCTVTCKATHLLTQPYGNPSCNPVYHDTHSKRDDAETHNHLSPLRRKTSRHHAP
jgi:hypothetical protein